MRVRIKEPDLSVNVQWSILLKLKDNVPKNAGFVLLVAHYSDV